MAADREAVEGDLLMRVRKSAADREAVEGDLVYHRSSPETAGPGRPTTIERSKL